jgi:hypothetical protein
VDLYYGSNTGTCEAYAIRVAINAANYEFRASVVGMWLCLGCEIGSCIEECSTICERGCAIGHTYGPGVAELLRGPDPEYRVVLCEESYIDRSST